MQSYLFYEDPITALEEDIQTWANRAAESKAYFSKQSSVIDSFSNDLNSLREGLAKSLQTIDKNPPPEWMPVCQKNIAQRLKDLIEDLKEILGQSVRAGRELVKEVKTTVLCNCEDVKKIFEEIKKSDVKNFCKQGSSGAPTVANSVLRQDLSTLSNQYSKLSHLKKDHLFFSQSLSRKINLKTYTPLITSEERDFGAKIRDLEKEIEKVQTITDSRQKALQGIVPVFEQDILKFFENINKKSLSAESMINHTLKFSFLKFQEFFEKFTLRNANLRVPYKVPIDNSSGNKVHSSLTTSTVATSSSDDDTSRPPSTDPSSNPAWRPPLSSSFMTNPPGSLQRVFSSNLLSWTPLSVPLLPLPSLSLSSTLSLLDLDIMASELAQQVNKCCAKIDRQVNRQIARAARAQSLLGLLLIGRQVAKVGTHNHTSQTQGAGEAVSGLSEIVDKLSEKTVWFTKSVGYRLIFFFWCFNYESTVLQDKETGMEMRKMILQDMHGNFLFIRLLQDD